ncbi:hypothetical protein VQH23_04860 [Pararoseomonas sp. SCSIO 73927]|uniref:hypothetical protein n=1 Tax=Pararoseomonas sp. SCSIO 73927 TaxID=3114537 RepID=UPI0030CF1F72
MSIGGIVGGLVGGPAGGVAGSLFDGVLGQQATDEIVSKGTGVMSMLLQPILNDLLSDLGDDGE